MEYAAAAFAMAGTAFMALHLSQTSVVIAWVAWIGGSVFFCLWAAPRRAWGVFSLNVVYIALDLIGLARAMGFM